MHSTDLHPQVSILVPCYNQGKYLRECLTSVIKQTYAHWECLVIDDGSTDDTRFVAEEFCAADIRFRYYHQENKGLSGARNTGIGKAKGKYLNFLDSDDTLLPDMIGSVVAEFARNPGLVLVFSGYIASRFELTDIVKTVIPGAASPAENFFVRFCGGGIFPVHAALINAGIVDQIGMFDETLRGCEDWDFWIRLARVSNAIQIISRVLVNYRMTLGSMTRDVGNYFNSGLVVLGRTVARDGRVRDPLPEHENGNKNDYESIVKSWYVKCTGLYLAKKDSSSAKDLLTRFFNLDPKTFDDADLFDTWRNILYGTILFNERRKAWATYKLVYIDFITFAETLYHKKGMAARASRRVRYYNAPLYRRVFLRLLNLR